MGQNPWWQPGEADLGWDEPLPDVITLAPDYGAEPPLWGNGFGNIAWQYTKFSPGLLDRLAAWQQEFDACCHWDRGQEITWILEGSSQMQANACCSFTAGRLCSGQVSHESI